MTVGYYMLNAQGEPVLAPDSLTWARWFETAERHVGNDTLTVNGKSVLVSTVFLGLDHNWGDGPPVLWESMIFGGPHNDYQERCSGSREQAEAMHQRVLALARQTRKILK